MRQLSIAAAVAGLLIAAGVSAALAPAKGAAAPDDDKISNQPEAGREPGSVLKVRDFTVNPHRSDPYSRANFRVRWDGQTISGVSYVSQISRRTEEVAYRDGADPVSATSAPGITTIQPVTLRRGVTHDDAFEKWADLVWSPAGPSSMSLKNYRKDIVIELLNLSGQTVKRYVLYRCWPIDYVALGALDAGADRIAEENLTIQCEGWERDKSVTEPAER